MRDPKRQTKCARMAAAKSTLFSFLSLSFFLFSSGVVEASVSSDAATTIEMHGSGTTNPSKYFWKAMDILEERAGKPVRMTYRAVGSGTGQSEFIGGGFGLWFRRYSVEQHSTQRFRWYCRASAVSARRGEFLSQRRRGRLGRRRSIELDQLYVGEDLSKRHHDLGRCDDCRGEPELICPGWATDYDHPSIGRVEFDVRDYELFVRGVSYRLDRRRL